MPPHARIWPTHLAHWNDSSKREDSRPVSMVGRNRLGDGRKWLRLPRGVNALRGEDTERSQVAVSQSSINVCYAMLIVSLSSSPVRGST